MEDCRPAMISPLEDTDQKPELGRPQHSPRQPGPPSTVEPPSAPAAEAQQLPDVWRHLKQLEKAVKSHIQSADGSYKHASTHGSGGIGRGGSSILAAAQQQHSTDSSSSSSSSDDEPTPSAAAARAARMSERDRLKESLSKLKSDVADKVVKQVEAQLLQQRVAHLEAALAGLTAAGAGGVLTAAGCPSCAGSYAGSMLSLGPGRASMCMRCQQCQGQQQQQPLAQQQAPRTSSPMSFEPGVSQLYNRLDDMEAAMRELAHAQATSSSVLSELGGRLSTGAGTNWSSSQAGGSQVRGSLLRRPPSCPPASEGALNNLFCSPPLAAQRASASHGRTPLPHRPLSACTMRADASPGGFSSVLANPVFSFDSPSRSSASPGTPPVSALGAAGDAVQQQQQARTPHSAALLQRVAQEQAQQAQEQHTWHVEVVLASHDAELAGVKESVSKLEAAQEATAALAEDTAMHVASLDDRIRVIEHGQPFFGAAGGLSGSAAGASAPAPAAAYHGASGLSAGAAGAPAAPALVPAYREAGGLSGSAAGTPAPPASAPGHQEDATYPEEPDLEATLSRGMGCSSLAVTAAPDAVPVAAVGAASETGAGPAAARVGAAQADTADSQAALVRQVLSSSLLEELIISRVAQAVAVQLTAAHTAASSSASTAPGWQVDAAEHAPGASTSQSEDAAAAEQAAIADASLERLHERLLAVEGALQQLLSSRAQHTEQQQQQHPADASPDASAGDQQAATDAAAAEDARAAESAAWSTEEPLAAEASTTPNPLGLDALQDEFGSFESASRWLSGSRSGNRGELPQASEASTAAPPQAKDPAAAAALASAAHADEGASDSRMLGSADCCIPAAAAAAFTCSAAQLAPPAAPLQEEPSAAHATPTAVKSALWSSRGTSTTQVETQLAALQQEVDACQVQSALQALHAKLQALQQAQAEQGVLIDSHKVSTGASLALLVPLEPRLDLVASQVSALHALVSQQPARFELLQSEIEQLSQQLAEFNEAAAQESEVQQLRERLEGLQQQHGQLQAGLAADIQAATDAAAAAAAMASTAVEAAAAVEATQQQLAAQWEQQAAAGILERLAAVEGSVQQLGSVQDGLSELQQQVAQHMQEAREQAAVAAAASSEQKAILDEVAASASELAGKLIALEVAVEDKVGEVAAAVCATTQQAAAGAAALEAKLQQQEQTLQAVLLAAVSTGPSVSQEVQGKLQGLQEALEGQAADVAAAVSAATQQAAETAAAVDAKLAAHDDTLRAAFTAAQEAHDADLKQQLREQVDTMAQILADMGSLKAEQAAACDGLQQQLQGLKDVQDSTVSDHATQLEQLTGQLQSTAQQLREELSSTFTPLQSELQSAADMLAAHNTALEGAASVAAAVKLLTGLPASVADVSARLDELAQAQRAAEGELCANKEHCLALDQQVAAAQAKLQVLEASLAAQQEQGASTLQQLRQEMLQPVVEELERLQAHTNRLQHVQLEQAAAVERLGGAVRAVKGDVLAELARERQQLAQAVEELQTVVSEQCIKTDQLGTIFAARDNMYGAWLKMQAVFDANRSPRRGSTATGARAGSPQDRSPSSSLLRPRHSLILEGSSPVSAPGGGAGSGVAQHSASGGASGFDPFSELIGRLAASPEPAAAATVVQADAEQSAAEAAAVPVDAQAAAPAAAAAAGPVSSVELAEVADAQDQLREEVASLAIQLHAAMADLSEQVSALRQAQVERQQQAPDTAAAAAEPSAAAGSSTEAPAAERITDGEAEGGSGSLQRAVSAGSGVLHAPLSLVVQLQQELSAMKADSISKEQFAAVVRMVKELRSHSCGGSEASSPVARNLSSNAAAAGSSRFAAAAGCLSAQPSGGSVCEAAPGVPVSAVAEPALHASADTDSVATDSNSSSSSDKVADLLQQHSQQLAAVESSLAALMHKAASAEVQAALQQQQTDLQQQQLDLSSALIQQRAELQAHTAHTAAQTADFDGSIGKLQADVQQQDAALEQLATVLASVSATQQEVKSLASQQGSMQAELAHVTAYVDELACKLQTAASAAALAMQARPQHASAGFPGESPGTPGGSTSSSSSGFSEMVAGLATLKACLDHQAGVIDDLRARLQDQGLVIQGLVEAAGQQGGDAAAEGVSDSQDGDSGSAAASQADVQDLAAQLHAVQQQLAALAARQTATAGCAPARAAASAGAQSEIQPLADQGEQEPEAGAAADSEPLGFLHGMLVELKKRISKLEADSIEAKATAVTVAALQAAASSSSSSSSNPAFAPSAPAADPVRPAASDSSPAAAVPAPQAAAPTPASPAARKGAAAAAAGRKGAAWPGHGGQNAAADVQQLQEWLVCLQGEVSRLDAADASLSATLDSLRGDVGAAAAAAAAAAIAAKLTAAGSPAAAAQSAAAGVHAKSSEASRSHVQQQGKEDDDEAADASELAQLACFTVGELRAQVAQLAARVDAQAAAAAADCRGSSSSSDSSAVAADVIQLKQEVLSEVAAMQQAWRDDAAAAPQHEAEAAAANAQTAVSAVAALSSSVSELQDRMAEVSAQAAAAAMLAASAQAASSSVPADRLLELQAQLEGVRAELLTLQQQVQGVAAAAAASSGPAPQLTASGSPADIRTSSTPAHTLPQAVPQGVSSTPSAEEECFSPTAVDAAAAQQDSPSEAQAEEVQRSLSFGDLADSSSSGGGLGASAGAVAAAAAAAAEASLPFEADFAGASPEGPGAAQCDDAADAAATAVPSRQASGADSSRDLSRASSSSTASASSSSSSSDAGKLSVRRLLEDMTSMPAAKQVAIVSKLAGLVSSHATRLLATYHEDPQLSAQLQSVQQRLAAAVHSASSLSRKQADSPSSPAAATNAARSGSTGVAAAAGSNSSSSEALLCILDQVASLRAIGSATHPAIAEKLQRHEAQLTELREAQQGILAAISALTGTDDATAAATQISNSLTDPVCTPTATAVTTQPPAAASSPEDEPAAAAAAAEPEAGQQGGSAEGSTGQQHPSGPAAYEGELAHRLADVEGRLASGLKVLAAVRVKLSPLQEVADATQSMMRELQVAHGLTLQRLESLEHLAATGTAATTAEAGVAAEAGVGQAGSVLVVASSLKKLQEDIQATTRRLAVLEGSVSAQVPECLTLSRRLAARQADAEARSSTATNKVSTLVSSLPPLVERVSELEARLTRSLAIAKQGLDILADQLVALGALNGRGSPNKKNPLAALGPHQAAITALEGKLEAVRTAMTASVKLMIGELGAAVQAAGSASSLRATVRPGVEAGVAGLKAVADEAAKAATASQEEAAQL